MIYDIEPKMTGKREHIDFIGEILSLYKKHCGTDEAHVISDLICDLGHYAEQHGIDFHHQVKNGIAHLTAEKTGGVGMYEYMNSEFE